MTGTAMGNIHSTVQLRTIFETVQRGLVVNSVEVWMDDVGSLLSEAEWQRLCQRMNASPEHVLPSKAAPVDWMDVTFSIERRARVYIVRATLDVPRVLHGGGDDDEEGTLDYAAPQDVPVVLESAERVLVAFLQEAERLEQIKRDVSLLDAVRAPAQAEARV